ncbi:MAG: beta strand repeat-containing protein, partial [Methylophilus sp.]
GTGVIVDNDKATVVTVEPGQPGTGDDSVVEGNNLVYTVTLSATTNVPTTYTYTLGGGTASTADYGTAVFSNGVVLNANGTINVPAGVSSFTVTVPTVDDTIVELNETLPLTIGGATGTGVIVDNDRATIDTITAGPNAGSVVEGNNLVYTVTLSTTTNAPTTYSYSLGGGTASTADYGSAVFSNGVSYNAATGTITVPAGVNSFTVTVPTIDDTLIEANETLPLNIGGKSATGIIIDNDIGITVVNGSKFAVSEEGLAGGIKDTAGNTDTTDSAVATGAFSLNATNSTGAVWTLTAPTAGTLTSGGVTVTWALSADGKTLTGSAGGEKVLTATINNSGAYTVTLNKSIDHPNTTTEDTLKTEIGVKVVANGVTQTTTLPVTIEDDSPVAINQTVLANNSTNTNVMITLDVSGSMAANDGVGGQTRLASAIQSIKTLLASYDDMGDIKVALVVFAGDGQTRQLGTTWLTVNEANNLLNTLSPNGNTNYDAALETAIQAYGTAGKLDNAQTVSYFFTDGEPNRGLGGTSDLSGGENASSADAGIQAAEERAWIQFLESHNIKSYALGLGQNTSTNQLDPIAYDGEAGVNTGGIKVTNFDQLDGVLSGTVAPPVSGSLASVGGFGADGGYVKSLVIEGSTYNFDGKTGAISVTGTNNSTYNSTTHELTVQTASGRFVVDMDNGKYTFTPGQTKVTLIDTTFNANGNGQDTALPAGWFTNNPSGKIEVNPSTTYGLSNSYGNVLELENFKGDSNIYTLINPGKNETVVLTFDYAARSGYTSGTDSAIQVLIDGKVVDTVNTKNLTMSNFSYTFTGTGNQMRVEFKSVDSNSTGGLLDNIKITTSNTVQPADSTKVTYTLSDNDGDTSTADLNISIVKNNTYVPIAPAAPQVGNALGSAGLLTLPGLLNVDLLNFSSRQAFTASDVNNNINNVTIAYSTLLGVTLGAAYMTFSQAVASELGLSVNYTQNSGFLGLIGANGTMVITAADGGTVDNLALNEFLSTVRVNEQLVDVSLLQSFTITATDTTNLQDSETSANLINIDLLSSANNSNIITGGDANNNVLTGTSGNDIIYGYAGNDDINGGAGNDILRGGAGSDTLNGGNGNDILIGGKGNDTLTGGAGVDVFKWDSGDEGVAGNPARDTITDFNKATVAQGGDVLDIRDLLQGENPGNLQNYLHFEKSGSDTIVHISSNGGFANDAHNVSGSFSSGNTTQQIVLSGVDITTGQSNDAAIINNLLAQQKLIVDQ